MRYKVWLALLAVYIVWGSTYLAIRFAVETMPPFLMASFRFLIAGTLLYRLAALRRRSGAYAAPVALCGHRRGFFAAGRQRRRHLGRAVRALGGRRAAGGLLAAVDGAAGCPAPWRISAEPDDRPGRAGGFRRHRTAGRPVGTGEQWHRAAPARCAGPDAGFLLVGGGLALQPLGRPARPPRCWAPAWRCSPVAPGWDCWVH